jgi:PAS domain S-box-containing protein
MHLSAMEMAVSRNGTKSRMRGRKLPLTGTRVRVGRAHKTRADLERQLKACRQKAADLRGRLAEATKQQTATSEMLRIIAVSPIQSVLDAVAEHAARLCGSNNAEIFRLENNLLRLVASYGEIPVAIQAREGIPVNRDSVMGRATCDRRTVHVNDLAAEDREYPLGSSNAKREGHRTTLATPLLRERSPIGVILIRRWEVRPFSDNQIALLETFANEAVIAIENVRLFEAEKQRTLALAQANRGLAQREAKIRRLVDSNIIGIFIWDFDGRILEANEAFLHIVGYDREDLVAGSIRWTDLTPPEWRDRDTQLLHEHKATGFLQPFEKEYFRKDGSRVPVLIGVASFEEGGNEGVAFVLDLTERKRAEERLRAQHTVAQILAEGATIEEATPRMLRAIGECLGWDVGALWRVDRDAKALRCVEFWHKASIEVPEFERLSREFTFVPGLGLPGRVWSSLEPEYIKDVVSDGNFPRVPIAEREGLHAAFGFPILLGSEVLGVIEFFSREIKQPDQELLNMLAAIGSQIGQFIERKRAEEQLRRVAAWLAQAQKLSHIGHWVMNGTTRRFLYWSDESYRIWGFDPLHGLPSREDFWERIHPDDREGVWGKVQETLREERGFFGEFRILLPDGTVKYLEASTRHEISPLGALLEVICTSVDVTERKRAEQALRESEAKFRDYAETASDWFWEIDRDYKFTLLSENAFGSGAADRIGTACWNHALDLETEPEKWRLVWATLDARKPFRDFVYRSLSGSGSPIYVKVGGKPVFDVNGEFCGYRGTGTDVTAMMHAQQLEESLRTVQAELTRVGRIATLGQSAASIAHEVTQPIASARNNTRAALNFLDRQPSNLGEVKEALECAVADADRAGQIVDRIRDHIKRAPPRKDRFDLNKAINEVLLLARSAITDNEVSVQTCLTEGSLPVEGDRVQVQQVVLNLVLNAVEAMGSVEESARELMIRSKQTETNSILVAVVDSGPGIDPENFERVFEAFYTTKSDGVGMGLSICRSIIEAHGGRLWADASEARGAVFQFTLPNVENL